MALRTGLATGVPLSLGTARASGRPMRMCSVILTARSNVMRIRRIAVLSIRLRTVSNAASEMGNGHTGRRDARHGGEALSVLVVSARAVRRGGGRDAAVLRVVAGRVWTRRYGYALGAGRNIVIRRGLTRADRVTDKAPAMPSQRSD
jgi:hypothetical protein